MVDHQLDLLEERRVLFALLFGIGQIKLNHAHNDNGQPQNPQEGIDDELVLCLTKITAQPTALVVVVLA